MWVISKRTLADFWAKHPDSERPLSAWYRLAEAASWNDFGDMKRTFNSVDAVGHGRFVFDILNNRYRLICRVTFPGKIVYIRFVGTHNDYEMLKGKDHL